MTGTGVEVFVSYSHKDEKYREQLEAHLSQLRHEGVVADCHDRKIPPGADWAEEIDQHVQSAEIILLLISSDFLASKYCVEIEMKRALERHAAGQARVIPIIVRPADWETARFAHLQAVPKNGRAITKWGNRDESWVSVIKGIRRVAREIQEAAAQASDVELSLEPDWRQKLDRIEQTGTARYLIGEMLKYGHPQCICFCWYGGDKDGVAVFHDRLESEFDVESEGRCWSIRPEWPSVVNRSAFRGMLRQTFDGQGDIGTAIRQHFRGRHDRRHLLYVNHSPVDSSKRLSDPRKLKKLPYLGVLLKDHQDVDELT